MQTIMTRLALDHARLTKLLDLLADLLDRFHEGDEPDFELMNEMIEYMQKYADVIHHPTEDLIFRRVLEKGEVQHDVFHVLMRQHAAITQVSQRFRESLESILKEEVQLREDVEANGRELVATMRSHLAMEDAEAFPIARARLTAEDWEAIAATAPNAEDPVFGSPDPVRFKALYHYLYEQTHS